MYNINVISCIKSLYLLLVYCAFVRLHSKSFAILFWSKEWPFLCPKCCCIMNNYIITKKLNHINVLTLFFKDLFVILSGFLRILYHSCFLKN